MSLNLANKSPEERLKIELDKQASFLVWQLKEGKIAPDAISEKIRSLLSEQEKDWFQQSINQYKKIMGVS
ncbi:DUF3283 family protein [Vibrio salinus]|uniref:DUF3283 family protein n=1 Tax=Vibrio salinus TaxID=2899784 RepID=UPI001E4768E4|nr:DUF3283 family protein [Vibrio salinus]MCE0495135.1 DUF3283 family protein [Vibrio salinus]